MSQCALCILCQIICAVLGKHHFFIKDAQIKLLCTRQYIHTVQCTAALFKTLFILKVCTVVKMCHQMPCENVPASNLHTCTYPPPPPPSHHWMSIRPSHQTQNLSSTTVSRAVPVKINDQDIPLTIKWLGSMWTQDIDQSTQLIWSCSIVTLFFTKDQKENFI